MIDYNFMDVLIGDQAFVSINEDALKITICVEDETIANGNRFLSTREILSFPLGENLFNFLSIPESDIKKIKAIISKTPKWDFYHEQDQTESFIASLDCIYLYLLFYSDNREFLNNEYSDRLDRILREFEFALNFCCNDDFMPELKPLTSLQRYYLYCHIYPDNIHTIDRQYRQNRYLFMEPSLSTNILNSVPVLKQEINHYGRCIVNEFDPVTKCPPNMERLITSLRDMSTHPVFRYEYQTIDRYLMEELFLLIKINARVKKCAMCHKYFILKGDYGTDYCDRIQEGEKYTCKKLAAIQTRKSKIQKNPILKEFERAYKRNYARQSNHKITQEEFRLWVESATQERDRILSLHDAAPSEQIIADFKEYLGNK